MASIDLRNVDPNGNEESISNLCGDTLLLGDDETVLENEDNVTEMIEENINTYADILRRESATPVEVTPSSETDNEEAYLGHGRLLTNFERAHFARDNVTPGRPCTAYFNSEYFVDSKAVFDKLSALEILRKSVLCLQRRHSGDMVITFTNEHVKKKFVSNVVIHFRESLSVINDEDMPLTFLNIYDAPYELSDEALTFRLRKYCIVHSTRCGKFARSYVNNGIHHFRVQIIQPLPSYLRFGKFLVRLSHDGQQHTCRRCNRADHFANDCRNVVCFNCEELGHQAKECGGPVLCCICKSPDHRARHCPYAWHQSSSNRDPSTGGHVAAPAGDLSSRDPASGGDVTAPACDLAHPSTRDDSLRDVFSSGVSDSILLEAAGTAFQSSDVSSGPRVLNKDGFLRWEKITFGNSIPNPPGPQSTAEESVNSAEQPVELPADRSANSSSTPDVPSADPPNVNSSDVSADPSDVSADLSVSADLPVSADDQSTDSPVVPPVVVVSDVTASSTDSSTADHSTSSPGPPSGRGRPSGLPRRKPAPMPAALEALTRRPTRPTLPVSGRSSTSTPPPPPDEMDMDAQSSLKRKQASGGKKGDPKKGKH